jgi:hypothetical protein
MKTTKITTGDETVYLVEDYFPLDLLEHLQNIFDSYQAQSPDWAAPSQFAHRGGREVYVKPDSRLDLIRQYASSDHMLSQVAEHMGNPVVFDDLQLWEDLPGYAIAPHLDITDAYDHAIQLYVTKEDADHLGTTFFNSDRKVLFQLPYRNNFGYVLPNPSKIWHGLTTPVPPGVHRHSVYLRYKRV